MDAEKGLLGAGIVLLALAALSGFVQHRMRENAEAFAQWRVVHAGGTAGAVQLLALSAVWNRFGQGPAVSLLAAGLIAATLAFFLGPLARALDFRRTATVILAVGGLLALPAYLALPLLVIF
jgi:hypothetical protein